MQVNLREYQKQDVEFMVDHKRVLNANEPGLGKTLETLIAVQRLPKGSTLVIGPKIATGVWQQEAEKWLGWTSVKITGEYKPKERKEKMKEFMTSKYNMLVINFAMVKEIIEQKKDWNTIIIDESHLGGLLNAKSLTFKHIKKLESKYMFILTGTPVRQGVQDLFPTLYLLDKEKFPHYWKFAYKYCHVIDNGFGKEILSRPKYPVQFGKMLRQNYMVRHLKKDVLKDLPDKIRQIIPVDLSKEQLRIYRELMKDMITDLGDEVLITPTILSQNLRLRQLLVTPRLLGVDEDGAALEALSTYLVPQEFDCGRSVVIATPFRTAIPYIKEALKKNVPKIKIFEIHGQIKESAADVAQRFQQEKNHKKVIIYTIKTGASWTAHSASTGFMLGYEWSVSEQVQAEDRIHRLGQKNTVFWKYIMHKNTVDELVANRLNEKNIGQNWILQPEEVRHNLEKIKKNYFKY